MSNVPANATQYAPKSISDVERETGLPRATIRIWERRYGFPSPVRDARGERCYSDAEVRKLRLMRDLVERGERPGRLLALSADALQALRDRAVAEAAAPARTPRVVRELLQLLRSHDVAGVRRHLQGRLDELGLAAFAGDAVPAFGAAIGAAWASGELQVHEEHLYSDCLQDVLRPATARLAALHRPEAPRVLLATFPQESHVLGLLIAQALFALQGCPTISLGARLPLDQIAEAARAHGAELIGLSFTASMNPTHVLRGLEALRGQVPAAVRIWAGGSAPVLRRRLPAGVRAVHDARDIAHLLAEDFALAPR
ncbi:MerR family transcriptional regulator [Ramlibacter sp.]|uniref:MerR family transcriptional regulator n=1 Tax=Ramlibacter sp. TaxID=1917967 RepID=UPI003D13BB9A